MGFPGGTVVNNSPAKAGDADDAGSIPGLGRSYGGKPGIPLQYSHLEIMDRGAWQSTVQGVTKSWTLLSLHTDTHIHTLKREFLIPDSFPTKALAFSCLMLPPL